MVIAASIYGALLIVGAFVFAIAFTFGFVSNDSSSVEKSIIVQDKGISVNIKRNPNILVNSKINIFN